MVENGADWIARFPWVRESFLIQGGREPEDCGRELGRFFRLTQTVDAPLAVISKNIDLLWHIFIEATETYGAYCEEAFGEFIHHRTRTEHSPVPDEAVRNFFDAYEHHYGPVPDLWIADADQDLVAYGRRLTDQLGEARWSGWPGRSEASGKYR